MFAQKEKSFSHSWHGVKEHKVTYDPKTDTLNVTFKEGVSIAESDEDKPGVILDYDAEGTLVSLEFLDASSIVSDTRKIEFEMTA